jgi:ketosteroid isomerase-like protein
MKTIGLFFLIAAVALIAGCAPKVVPNKDQALADSLLKVNVNAYNSGDVQKIADMYTDDCLNYSNGKGVWSKDSILVWAKSTVPFIKNFKATLGPTTVSTDLIFMQKYWTLDYIAGSNTLKTRGLSTLIWIKQSDSSWKIAMEKSDYSIKTY